LNKPKPNINLLKDGRESMIMSGISIPSNRQEDDRGSLLAAMPPSSTSRNRRTQDEINQSQSNMTTNPNFKENVNPKLAKMQK